ncbi:MAG: hypothetical protein BECKG1743D_GA0114223_106812 [Candidatus Kentron sp. G]|nr:MAG: hypothetical protein BECKG1743D_GA0114223_106812 [Candidatus Kentron sp. G]
MQSKIIMSIYVELLNEQGNPIAKPRHIVDVAQPFLDAWVGDLWRAATPPFLFLLPYPWEDNRVRLAQPSEHFLDYHTDAIGFIQIEIVYANRFLYRHPHTVAEVLGPGLIAWLQEAGIEKAAAYRITGEGIGRLVHRSAPIPEGVTEVTPYAPGEGPAFRIRPIPPAPPEPKTLAAFGALEPDPVWEGNPDRTDFVKVLVDSSLYDDLLHQRRFSEKVEEGGFLIGRVYEDKEQPETFIAHVTGAIPAEQVGASFLHFTFTGDSFDRIKQRLTQDHPEERLLGWYVTSSPLSYFSLALIPG